jgi:hypothetical protein
MLMKHGDSNKNPKKSLIKHKASHEKQSGVCVIHQKGCGHRTDNCKVVLAMVDSDKRSDKKVSFKKDNKRPHKNKSWLHKSDKAKDKTKKDLAAFTRNMVKKEMNAVQKKDNKRKKDDNNNENDNKAINAFDFSMTLVTWLIYLLRETPR